MKIKSIAADVDTLFPHAKEIICWRDCKIQVEIGQHKQEIKKDGDGKRPDCGVG